MTPPLLRCWRRTTQQHVSSSEHSSQHQTAKQANCQQDSKLRSTVISHPPDVTRGDTRTAYHRRMGVFSFRQIMAGEPDLCRQGGCWPLGVLGGSRGTVGALL